MPAARDPCPRNHEFVARLVLGDAQVVGAQPQQRKGGAGVVIRVIVADDPPVVRGRALHAVRLTPGER
jgi:hypothetical protein